MTPQWDNIRYLYSVTIDRTAKLEPYLIYKKNNTFKYI